jgi:hypothetical protein
MIELNMQTLPDVHDILIRKSDCSIQLITRNTGKYPEDQRFNLSGTSEEDRMLCGSMDGAIAAIVLLERILKKSFRLTTEDDNYVYYFCMP